MSDDAIDAAHERMAEQLMSDERVLGALPEDAAGVLLDWALARLDDAAASATDVSAFVTAADAIRREARAQADAAADCGDDAVALAARLGSASAAPAQAPDAVPQTADQTDAELSGRALSDDAGPVDQPNIVASTASAQDEVRSSDTRSGSLWDRLRRFFAPRRGEP